MVQDFDAHLPQMTEEEVEKFWENPDNVMRLVDLIFLMEDPDREDIPS